MALIQFRDLSMNASLDSDALQRVRGGSAPTGASATGATTYQSKWYATAYGIAGDGHSLDSGYGISPSGADSRACASW